MRKLLLLLFCMCMICTLNVKAETSSDSQYTYTVDGYVKYTNSEYITDTFALEYKSDCPLAAYIYYYKNGDLEDYTIYFIKKLSDGTFHSANYFSMINVTSVKNSSIREFYRDSSRKELIRKNNIDIITYNNLKTYEDYELHFSMPLFESREDAESYLNGEKSEKDALNYESDLCKIKYDLEVPQNMKAVRDEGLFTGALKFTWTQSAEGYEEWETEFYVFQDFKYRSSFLTLSLADWKYAEKFYLFTEYVDTRKLYFRSTEEIFEKHDVQRKRSEAYPCEYGGFYEPLVDEYYIRNHYFDGDTHHYSNWVVVSFDYESGDIVTTIKELEGSEIEHDENGNVVVGTTNQNQNSQYGDGYDIYSEESSSDIVNFIKSGFGLLGEDGVLTLLSQTFSFIPTELWSVFIAGMAFMVLIAIAKFVRG